MEKLKDFDELIQEKKKEAQKLDTRIANLTKAKNVAQEEYNVLMDKKQNIADFLAQKEQELMTDVDAKRENAKTALEIVEKDRKDAAALREEAQKIYDKANVDNQNISGNVAKVAARENEAERRIDIVKGIANYIGNQLKRI